MSKLKVAHKLRAPTTRASLAVLVSLVVVGVANAASDFDEVEQRFLPVNTRGVAVADQEQGTASELPPAPEKNPYVHLAATLALGRGLRVNNPFRLSTPLGTSESLSLSAPYLDVGILALTGHPDGLQHGGAVKLSVALSGVPQEAITPSYVALYRLRRVAPFFRVGVPFVTRPDFNWGGELALGASMLVQQGWGFTGQAIYSHFLGAATPDRDASVISLMSLEAGVWFDYEVLP